MGDVIFYGFIAFCFFDAIFLLAVLRGGALREQRQAEAPSLGGDRP